MTISEQLMRGEHISKGDCFTHAVEIERTMGCYSRAMAAMEKHELLMQDCTCEFDGGYGDDGSIVKRFPVAGCPVHTEEDSDANE